MAPLQRRRRFLERTQPKYVADRAQAYVSWRGKKTLATNSSAHSTQSRRRWPSSPPTHPRISSPRRTGTCRSCVPITTAGISAANLNKAQSALLRELLEEFVRRYRPELADAEMQKVDRAGADKLFFAWMGGTEPGQGHYYRIQGPHFIAEYDCTQNNANHIHTVWRDLENDFGDDLLKRHYEQNKHGK